MLYASLEIEGNDFRIQTTQTNVVQHPNTRAVDSTGPLPSTESNTYLTSCDTTDIVPLLNIFASSNCSLRKQSC